MHTPPDGDRIKFYAALHIQSPEASIIKFRTPEQFVHTVADEHR